MKRRHFLQSVSAALGTAAFKPSLALASAPSVAPMTASYTPYMQAHALAWIRTHGRLSMGDFLQMSKLNPAQAEAMLGHFIKSGYIQANSLSSGMIGAIRPDWMKAQSGVAKMVNRMPSKIAEYQEKSKSVFEKLDTDLNLEEDADEPQEISAIYGGSGHDECHAITDEGLTEHECNPSRGL